MKPISTISVMYLDKAHRSVEAELKRAKEALADAETEVKNRTDEVRRLTDGLAALEADLIEARRAAP